MTWQVLKVKSPVLEEARVVPTQLCLAELQLIVQIVGQWHNPTKFAHLVGTTKEKRLLSLATNL